MCTFGFCACALASAATTRNAARIVMGENLPRTEPGSQELLATPAEYISSLLRSAAIRDRVRLQIQRTGLVVDLEHDVAIRVRREVDLDAARDVARLSQIRLRDRDVHRGATNDLS